MIVDYTLPGSVVALKFLFKLYIAQNVNKVDFFRAILNFPIDLAFLAISFAALVLPYMQVRQANPLSTKEVLFWFVAYVFSAFVVTLLTKKSDHAFVLDKLKSSVAHMLLAYFISIFVIVASLFSIG
jgi:hypothetical protein